MQNINQSFCPHCGNHLDNSTKFCPYCGKETVIQNNENLNSTNTTEPKKKKNLKKYITSICSVGAVILLIMGFMGVFDKPAHEVTDGAYGYSEAYSVGIKDDEILIDTQKAFDKMTVDSKVVMVIEEVVYTSDMGWVACFVETQKGNRTSKVVKLTLPNNSIDLSAETTWIIGSIYTGESTAPDGVKVADLEVYSYRVPGQPAIDISVNSDSSDINLDSIVDLYEWRIATEEVLISSLGFTKNEYSIYPSENDLIFMCMDGLVYSIALTEDDIGKYSFLGVSIGDKMNDSKEKLSNFYTLIETTTATDGLFRDLYQDNICGSLIIDYDMSTYEIKYICYVAENSEEDNSFIQGSDKQEIIDSKEFTYWDETREDLIKIDFVSDTTGYITFHSVQYADAWSESEEINNQCLFSIYDENSRFEIFEIFDLDGNYLNINFEITYEQCPILIIYDEVSGTQESFLEKEYAYNNVG